MTKAKVDKILSEQIKKYRMNNKKMPPKIYFAMKQSLREMTDEEWDNEMRLHYLCQRI